MSQSSSSETVPQLKKAVILGMLPGSLSLDDRFKLAHDLGFDGVEVPPVTDPAEIKSMRDAADKELLTIQQLAPRGKVEKGLRTPMTRGGAGSATPPPDVPPPKNGGEEPE